MTANIRNIIGKFKLCWVIIGALAISILGHYSSKLFSLLADLPDPQILVSQNEVVEFITVSNDGTLLAVSGGDGLHSYGKIDIFNTNDWQLEKTLEGFNYRVSWVAFVFDNQGLISSDTGGNISLWDFQNGEEKKLKEREKGLSRIDLRTNTLSISNNQSDLALGGKNLSLLNLETGNKKVLLDEDNIHWRLVAFSSDDEMLATALSKLDENGDRHFQIKIWDLQKDIPIQIIDDIKAIKIAFVPNSFLLMSTELEGQIKFWDIRTGELKKEFLPRKKQAKIASVSFSPDGSILAAGYAWTNEWTSWASQVHGEITLWNMESGEPLYTIKNLVGNHLLNEAISFSPDGRFLAATDGNSVKVWDISNLLR